MHLVIHFMNAIVTLTANVDALLQPILVDLFSEKIASVHFFRNQMMKRQAMVAFACRANAFSYFSSSRVHQS